MLAAVKATDERLIAHLYLIQIFANLAFTYTILYCWLSKTLVTTGRMSE